MLLPAAFQCLFSLKGDLSEAQEGDPKYLAPELMRGCFSKAADIFRLVKFVGVKPLVT